ncbi:MAG: SufE family protein [Flammeovirgaceae bacterium]|nr:SufE family protein [Flammeovirgaceae bacterium]
MTIDEAQQEIIDEFALLGDDRESTIYYIMELGEKLPELDEKYKKEDNIIKGCQSKVWLVTELKDDKIIFNADSNTAITKGLISLLIRIYSGRGPKEIMNTDLYFMEKIGMQNVIGSQRSNGLTAMIKQIKLYGLAYQAKIGS